MRRAARMGAMLALVAITAGSCALWLAREPVPATSPTPTAHATTASASPSPIPTEWDRALAEAADLPLAQAAGQVIMQAIYSPDPAAAAELVRSRHLAGVIVMGDAVTDAESVTALNAAVAGAEPSREWPVMIATDQEGGVVQRLRPVLGYVSAFMAAGANGNPAQVEPYYEALGSEMAALGFTMDMAPVADVTIGVADPTIRTRSAGSRPDAVAEAVGSAWHGLSAGGVTPVLKHFPGHGSLRTDSHDGLPVQKRSVAQMESTDLVPFARAIEEGAPAVMMGHIRVAQWGRAPASVNPKAYEYLRTTLGFTGLAMTDAMNMEAITDRYSAGEAAAAAIAAGADLVVMPEGTAGAIRGIVAAVDGGSLSRERLNDAVAHVIVAARAHERDSEPAVVSRNSDFVEGSIVVAAKNCDALIASKVKISGGTAAQRKALAGALAERGVTAGSKGTSILLVEGDRGHGKASVVVALGGPWGLPRSTATAYIATWGSGADQLDALAAVLTGDVAPRGTWPVKLKLPYDVCG